jgi:LuxR family maltose regulon positive regulatory protein
MLGRGLETRVTLVGAPPGWGKTTAVGAWCDTLPATHDVAWVSLDDGDNDPVRFWTYAVEAVRTVEPGLGADCLALLRSAGTSVHDVVLPLLLNQLARLDRRLTIVLDDYHLVTNPEIHRALGLLIERMPAPVSVVITTRSDPPLPLSRLRARGELLEVRAAELRFTLAEAAALLNDLLELDLSPADVTRLQQRTEGWAAGLYLAALSLRDRADRRTFLDAFAGDDRHIVDYLGTEVLDRQPEGVREFLLDTAVLDRLCAPLCDAVTERTDSAELLEQLERSNLFVVPLDAKRRWYRYHRLFAELLRYELATRRPDAAAALHERAARWHRAHGEPADAIHHAAASDVVLAADLVDEHWTAFFNEGRLATVSGWLGLLERQAVVDARLCVAGAWIALDTAQLDDAATWIVAAEQAIAAGQQDGRTAASVATTRVVHRFKVGDMGGALQAAAEALALDADAAPFDRTVVRLLRGVTSFWLGDAKGSAHDLEAGSALATDSENTLGSMYALGYLGLLHLEYGRTGDGAAAAERALALGDDPARAEHFVASLGHLARGLATLRVAGAAAAGDDAARAVDLAGRGAGRLELAYALALLGEVRSQLGDSREASRCRVEARKLVEFCPDPGPLPELLARVHRKPRSEQPVPRAAPALREELSERELEVLRLLPTQLTQREIGASLYVSVNTVKTHTRNVFRKLGASTREEAVARARELGLL